MRRNKKKLTLCNHIINSGYEENYYAAMRLKRTLSEDKGAIPTVLCYNDNRRKAVTNELDRPYERKHISIHYLQGDALLHHALQCTQIPSSKFLLAFLRLLIRFRVVRSDTILRLSDSFRSRRDYYIREASERNKQTPR